MFWRASRGKRCGGLSAIGLVLTALLELAIAANQIVARRKLVVAIFAPQPDKTGRHPKRLPIIRLPLALCAKRGARGPARI